MLIETYLKRLMHSREEEEYSKLINIGSFGLHVVHGAFKIGTLATGWEINKILHAMWEIFNESPVRRDIYLRERLCEIFPLHFCKTRWVEDEAVAERAIQLWPNIVKIVMYWLSLPVSKRPRDNKSYNVLAKHHSHLLAVARLYFLDMLHLF